MLRAKMFDVSGSKIRVYSAPRDRRKAVWFLLAGSAALLVYFLLANSPNSDYSTAGQSAGFGGLVAFIIGLVSLTGSSEGLVFDTAARSIQGTDSAKSYDEFSAVRMRKEIVKETQYNSETGTSSETSVTYYCLDLIRTDTSYDISEIALGTSSDEGLAFFLGLPGWRVTSHTNQLQVWRVSERLARELQILHVDAVGHPSVTRFASELDTPLVDLLGRRVAVPTEKSKPRKDLVIVDGTKTSLRFTLKNEIIFLLVLGLLPWPFLAISGVFARTPIIWQFSIGTFGVLLFAALLMHFRPRLGEIRIDDKEVVVKPGWGFRKSMPLRELESIRVETAGYVSLLSDRKIIRFAAESGLRGDWIRDQIFIALSRTRDMGNQTPYR